MKKVLYGTGIAGFGKPSIGLGLDVLSLQFAAMKAAKENGTDIVLQQMGTVGYNIDEETRSRIISEQSELFNRMGEKLSKLSPIKFESFQSQNHTNFKSFAPILDETKERLKVFNKIPNWETVKNYTELQTAQMRRFIEDDGMFYKVGWSMSSKNKDLTMTQLEDLINKRSLSEFYFDQIFKFCYPELKLGYEYVPADIDFATGLQRAPYTVVEGEQRPLLNERFSKFCSKVQDMKSFDVALKRFEKKIVKPFEQLFGELSGDVIEKVDQIQDQVIGEI